MKNWKVWPSTLKGVINIPPSKSQTMRALLFGLLSKGQSVINNVLPSCDTKAMITACSHLGGKIEQQQNIVKITGIAGKLYEAEDVIQAGNSGLVARFMTALGALASKPIIITGDYSIRHIRPLKPLLDALVQLGVEVMSTRRDGGAPVLVKGPLLSGMTIMGGEDSQPVSALLVASAFAPHPIEICVTNPGEKPWVHLTLSWLGRFGIPYVNRDFSSYKLQGNASIEAFNYTVPADFSSLGFPLVAAILTGSELQIKNIDFSDPQGDKKLIQHVQNMGASLEIDEKKHTLVVKKTGLLRGISLDVNDCIDATPLLAVLGCFAEGRTEIKGALIARKKESDRLSCITQELCKMGGLIQEQADGLIIYPSTLKGTVVHSHQDHRLALALAVAAFAARGETIITDVDCTEKSYPDFCKNMQKIGGKISVCL